MPLLYTANIIVSSRWACQREGQNFLKGRGLFSAVAVVGQHPGGRIVHVAALPGPVGHPEVPKHPVPAGMVLPEDLPVQQAHLGKGRTTAALPPQRLKVKIRPAVEGQQLFLGTDLLKKPWPRTWAEAPPG